MILGVIADDVTGVTDVTNVTDVTDVTDVASLPVRAGLRTLQSIGGPAGTPGPGLQQADAAVVALKSRTAPAAGAVAQSPAARRQLRAAGAPQFYVKACSTFESTPAANTGPLAEALMAALGTDLTIACQAFSENGRTVSKDQFFVGDALRSDAGMRQHRLTPLTDANQVRVLQAHCQGTLGLLRHDTLAQGAESMAVPLDNLRARGVRLVVADAVDNADLQRPASGAVQWPLWVAGSGLAPGLPALLAAGGSATLDADAAHLDALAGPAAVLAGASAQATQAQLAQWISAGRPALQTDAAALARAAPVVATALAWAALQTSAPLRYATTGASTLASTQATVGSAQAGALVQQAPAQIAQGLVAAGSQRLVVAGGETSGAVVQAPDVALPRIGAAICPGVRWAQAVRAAGQAPLRNPRQRALTSGNFGGTDFFAEALGLA